jgi:hypothetical protein
MPSGQPYYETEGNGINWGVAKTNVARREGVRENLICYLGEVKSDTRSGSSSSSDIGDVGGYVIIGAVLFGIWLLVEYWWIVVPVAALALIAWLYSKFSDN